MTDLTIILLLKDRQEYNYRFISHFLENSLDLNLFISDGSQFTTGAAENPTLTIVSLAIRQAEHIAKEMSKGTI